MENQQPILCAWREQSMGYQFMHAHAAKRERTLDCALTVPAIVFGGISGSTIFGSDAVLAGGCGLAATILYGLRTFLAPGEKKQRHQDASASYKQLVHHIEWILAHRCLPEVAVDAVYHRYNMLLEMSADLPPASVAAFRRIVEEFPPAVVDPDVV